MKMNALFVRYILTGLLNTAFGYVVFALLVFLGLHYPVAMFLATIAGICFNFQTFGRFVFGNHSSRLIWKFFIVYGVLYCVNVCCVFILLKFMPNVYLANAMTVIFIAGLGFLLNRRFVYQ